MFTCCLSRAAGSAPNYGQSLDRSLLRTQATGKHQVRVDGPQVLLEPNAAQALAVTLHELATNAAKYGALSISGGQISVSWDGKPNGQATTLILEWRERGGPPVATNVQSSYGTNLIRDLIPHELGGTVALAFRAEGVNCRIEVPLEAVNPDAGRY